MRDMSLDHVIGDSNPRNVSAHKAASAHLFGDNAINNEFVVDVGDDGKRLGALHDSVFVVPVKLNLISDFHA